VNIEEFYKEDPRRRASGEADYGVWWRNERPFPRHRVSYIQATGEVYSVELMPGGAVDVLGQVEPDESDIYYRTLDGILDGWPEMCGTPNGLSWLRERLGGGA